MYDFPRSGNDVPKRPLFPLGAVLATPGALACLERCAANSTTFLERHQRGDWGDVSPQDSAENNRAVTARLRILSSYAMANGERLWIITEADRSATTLLLPEEY
jgi:hypothetical protein